MERRLSSCISISSRDALEMTYRRCDTQLAFGEHRAHTAFTPAGLPAMKSSASALALRSLPALEAIENNSEHVAQAT
jgi:hypothetical protein